jgi:hypothetical protein
MRVTEVHPAIRGHGDPGVLGHLLALVPRQCLEQRLRQRLDHLGHQPRHGLGIPAIRQLPHQAEPGPPLDDRDQPTRVVVNDEVTLPMTRHSPVSGDRGSVNQAGTLEPGTIGSAGQLRLRFATGPPRTKCLDHREFVTKTPGSLQIKGLVDRLVRHVQVFPVRGTQFLYPNATTSQCEQVSSAGDVNRESCGRSDQPGLSPPRRKPCLAAAQDSWPRRAEASDSPPRGNPSLSPGTGRVPGRWSPRTDHRGRRRSPPARWPR